MKQVSFYEKDAKQLVLKQKFDLGVVLEVVKEPVSKTENSYKKSTYLETQPLVMNYYHIKFINRPGVLRFVPSVGRSVRKIYSVGDVVLIAYLEDNYQPVILTDIDFLPVEHLQNRAPAVLNEGDVCISTGQGASVHLSEGQVRITGEDSISEHSSVTLLIGEGAEQKSLETDEPIVFRVYGNSWEICVDASGDLKISSNEQMSTNSVLKEHVSFEKETVVGVETNKDNSRQGTDTEIIHKKKQVYVGEEYEIKVGDKDKSDNRNKAVFRLNSTYKIELVGDDGKAKGSIEIDNKKKKLVIEYEGKSIIIDGNTQMIKIGSETATEPLVLGHKLMSVLVPLYGWATTVGTMLGIPPQALGCSPPGPNLISTHQFTQQT